MIEVSKVENYVGCGRKQEEVFDAMYILCLMFLQVLPYVCVLYRPRRLQAGQRRNFNDFEGAQSATSAAAVAAQNVATNSARFFARHRTRVVPDAKGKLSI